ncbi:MAG: hypothetical protein U0872_10170 [Planctomycetaceae bacterium]
MRADSSTSERARLFLGSAYLNYGFTVISLTILYVSLHYGFGWTNQQVTPPLVAYFIIVPLVMFRYARSLWLAMDCYYDVVGAQQSDPYQPAPPSEQHLP